MNNSETVTSKCSICDKEIPNGEEFHSFGEFSAPTGPGEWVDAGTSTALGQEFAIVEWSGEFVTVKYVECETCFDFFDGDEDE